eukprot:TRINITY_DN4080_c0_g1_i2.p1 TRINITY_DN4080_c0_g1~~TRINITY_DN4080_c0_g1_i2.p1  ORF type:complete len:257 (+),score=52.51 TRINITY_DN4080_c0_g1_i2:158-928(+)
MRRCHTGREACVSECLHCNWRLLHSRALLPYDHGRPSTAVTPHSPDHSLTSKHVHVRRLTPSPLCPVSSLRSAHHLHCALCSSLCSSLQDTISFAQYWRDPYRLDDYLEKSKFLADLNNERADKNYTYVERLRSLHHLVLVRSSIDEVIVPSEAEWFGQFNVSQSGELITLAMNETQMYKEDWLGLRDMNENSQVHLFEVACLHQDFPTDACKQFFNETTMPYLDDVCQSFGVKNYDTYYDWEKNFDHQFEEEQEE